MTEVVGRPTLFRGEYCDYLIEHMGSGLSFQSFSGTIGVATSTLYQWLEGHDDFREAYEIGKAKCLLWWDKLGVQAAQGLVDGFPQGHYALQTRNRFGWGGENCENEGLQRTETPILSQSLEELVEDAKRLAEAISEEVDTRDDILPPETLNILP